jgi:hypothetical protein
MKRRKAMSSFIAWMDAHSWAASIIGAVTSASLGALFGWVFGTRGGKKTGKAAAEEEVGKLGYAITQLQTTIKQQAEEIQNTRIAINGIACGNHPIGTQVGGLQLKRTEEHRYGDT